MNKERRRLLATAISHLNRADDLVNMALDQESDCLSNMPENLECSQRYEKMEVAVSNMEDALSSIGEAIESLDVALE